MPESTGEQKNTSRTVVGAENSFRVFRAAGRRPPSVGWISSGLLTIASTLISNWGAARLGLAGVFVIYLVSAVLIALRFSAVTALFSALTNVLIFDFIFIPPPFRFSMPDLTSAMTCGGMVTVTMVVSGLTTRLRRAEAAARAREARSSILYALSRALSEATNARELAGVAAAHFERLTGMPVAILLRDEGNTLAPGGGALELTPRELEAVRASWARGISEPVSTKEPSSLYLLPLAGARVPVGVLVARADAGTVFETDEEREIGAVCAQHTAMSIERSELAARATSAQLAIETERARSALLSSLSHDFRTPLAAIVGAGNSLAEFGNRMDPTERLELAQSIVEEGERLHRLLTNVLGLTRLEGGALNVKMTPHALDEVVDSALRRIGARIDAGRIRVDIPMDTPLATFDPVLIEQLLINVLENALRYAPPGSPVDVTVRPCTSHISLTIADRGPGVAKEDESRIFDKFFRSANADHRDGGMGLGLAICKAIARAHAGRIEARNRNGGGLEVTLSLPPATEPAEIEPVLHPLDPAADTSSQC